MEISALRDGVYNHKLACDLQTAWETNMETDFKWGDEIEMAKAGGCENSTVIFMELARNRAPTSRQHELFSEKVEELNKLCEKYYKG